MRVIGGVAGGRRLAVPPRGTRPTSDRTREALFSSLGSLLGGWGGVRVVDLYAGSGALGLEALSRGAETACFVERDRAAIGVLGANIETVGLTGAQVIAGDVDDVVVRPAEQAFDLALLDPPYATPTERVRSVLCSMATHGWLSDGAVVVVERDAREVDAPWPDDAWEALRQRSYGDTALWYGRFLGTAAREP